MPSEASDVVCSLLLVIDISGGDPGVVEIERSRLCHWISGNAWESLGYARSGPRRAAISTMISNTTSSTQVRSCFIPAASWCTALYFFVNFKTVYISGFLEL